MTQRVDEAATGGANQFLRDQSETAALYDQARQLIPGGTSRIHYFFKPYPIYARSGQGCRVTDADGVERLDFLNNMTSLIHGHGNALIKQAMIEQIELGTAFSEPAEQELRLASLLAERVPTMEQMRFANSGTEAVMMAIKLARAYTGRSRFAKFEGHYHGYYDYVQISYASTPANWGPEDSPVSTISSGGLADSVPGDVLTLPYNNFEAVEAQLEKHGDELSCLILDPLSQRAGCPMPKPGFFKFLREITRKHGIVLIFDEVISFRIGYGGAQGAYGGDPDLTTLGKIMGGGLPVGAVGGRAEVMAMLDPTSGSPKVASGGTFSANPMSMTAGHAAMSQMTPAEYDRLNALGADLRARSNAVFRAANEPGQLAGDGSFFRMLLTWDEVINYRSSVVNASPAGRMAKLHTALLDEGIIIGKDGLGCLSTPMGQAEVDAFVSALERAIQKLP